MSRWYRLRWSRVDNLIVHGALVLGITVTGLTGLYALVWITPLLPAGEGMPVNTVTSRLPQDAPEPRVDVATTGAAYEAGPVGLVRLTFHDPTTLERFLLVFPALLGLAALVVMAMVSRVIRSLGQGDPFVPANVRRVSAIAFTVLAASVLVPLARMACDGVLRSRALGTEDFTFTVGGPDGVSLTHVFAGLVLAALAEVFRRGTRPREDVRGLV
ncbi:MULTISPECIES: DUF2975 domain-containing protein [Nocardiopsis]|uniref:DUF2975 domain-containing protein n=1 Tax=Nocardiopsis sinuspersici TaxID=501010 RepID=A0A1V3BY87_9ACTN|nr:MULTISPECIES: DUF2975 domain-containing protein [Nocardiopsis]OOC53196.1 hypothetical protein NOSIN_04630 [Nocardiopsis sinuspersici]